MNIKIISEDDYGGAFLKNVIVLLKNKNIIGNVTVKAKPMRPLCNLKLDRILKAFDNSCDKIIIILDSDDPQKYESRYANVERHVPPNLRTPVKIILADYEIEEWICISKNLKWSHSKPSEELKVQFGYIKSSLPKYAAELDFDVLSKNCTSFKAFLTALVTK